LALDESRHSEADDIETPTRRDPSAEANPWLTLDALRHSAENTDSDASDGTAASLADAAHDRQPAPETAEEPVAKEGEKLPDPEIALRSRPVGGAGYIAPHTSRRDRRARAKAAHERERAQRKVVMRERRATLDAEKQARRDASYLPGSGEKGAEAGRSLFRLKVEPHRATSDVLAVGYPFLAEAGLGSEGTLIGHDSWSGAAFCFDPWNLYARNIVTNPNVLLAGIIGRGKSSLAKSLATRSIAFGRRVYVPGDPKGEWTPVARAVGGVSIELGGGHQNRLNPLDEGPRPAGSSDEEWLSMVESRRIELLKSLTEQALERPLFAVEHTALRAALTAATTHRSEESTPTLPDVVNALLEPPRAHIGSTIEQLRDDGRDPGHALGRLVFGDLAGLFDGESTVHFDPQLPMVTLDLSRISGSDALIALVMTCASAWMEAAVADPSGGQRWMIYDEAWRLLRNPALLARMQSQWKLSRHLGIANLMVIHRLSDLDAIGDADSSARNLALGLLADCSTRIIYAQERGEAQKTGEAIGLSPAEIVQVPDLARGEGLWRIGERAFIVSHDLTPGELEVYDTDARMHSS
jgi:hypothetical protein